MLRGSSGRRPCHLRCIRFLNRWFYPVSISLSARVNNMNLEAGTQVRGFGWGNGMAEAYTGNHAGHRAVRTRLKVDTAP